MTDAETLALRQVELLSNIKAALPDLELLQQRLTQNWVDEEFLYRFYYQSFKVFIRKESTTEIYDALAALAPRSTPPDEGASSGERSPLNEWFTQIVTEGTSAAFELSMNDDWLTHARPVLEAYHHARQFLDLVVGYGKLLDAPPTSLPTGWAAVLMLFNLR
jgi:hypothetical protein